MSGDVRIEKVPIGGWLIVAGILLWLGVIGGAFSIVSVIALPLPPHSLVSSGYSLIIAIISFVLFALMLVMFHQRRAALVKYVVVWGGYAFLDECYIQYVAITAHLSPIAGHVAVLLIDTLLIVLFVMYFLKSSRVKRTFVR